VVPTPVIAPATVCVVETGAPTAVETNSALAAAVSAVNPPPLRKVHHPAHP
jgi:hypothetical protein